MRAVLILATLALAGCGEMLAGQAAPPTVTLDLRALVEAYQQEDVEIIDLPPDKLRRLRLACLTSAAVSTPLDAKAASACEIALQIAKPVPKPE